MPEVLRLAPKLPAPVGQPSKGIQRYRLSDGTVGWFKPADRKLNNFPKVRDMGLMDGGSAESTEAHAFLPEREVAASEIAASLIPHLAVRSQLAILRVKRGVFMEHVEGSMASEHIDYEAEGFPLKADLMRQIKPQLADLQAFDYLIGNVDRHVENFMIDATKPAKVRAIDNDLSFPTIPVAKLTEVQDSKFGGLPTGYTVVVAERIRRMDENTLVKLLRGVFVGAPKLNFLIDETLKRLRDLKRDVVLKQGKAASPQIPSNYTGLAL